MNRVDALARGAEARLDGLARRPSGHPASGGFGTRLRRLGLTADEMRIVSRGGTSDVPRTLRLCRLLAADHEDMVVKAMSWALREVSKRDPAAVRAFLERHSGVLAARVVREVTNKLVTGRKNPKPATGAAGRAARAPRPRRAPARPGSARRKAVR
jgi:hypothetical protein